VASWQARQLAGKSAGEARFVCSQRIKS